MKRYFEFIGSDGKTDVDHSKFWEIWVDGTILRSRYGKIGANGQTTLKEFGSVEEAEAAQAKAIIEKTKKGYTEPASIDKDSDEEDQDSSESSGKLDENDPEVIEGIKDFKKWAKEYEPIAYINFELTEYPTGIPENHIWSECNAGEYSYIYNSFEAFSPDTRDPATSYVIAKNPYPVDGPYISVNTELSRFCERCDGEGELDGEECSDCEGMGTQYFEMPANYPLIISTQEELDSYIASKSPVPTTSVKFCPECGTKREPATAKFCAECGHAF